MEGALLCEVQWLRMIYSYSNCSSNSVLLHLLNGLACNVFMRMYTAHVPQIHWIYCVVDVCTVGLYNIIMSVCDFLIHMYM